jgi:hypothetical protein
MNWNLDNRVEPIRVASIAYEPTGLGRVTASAWGVTAFSVVAIFAVGLGFAGMISASKQPSAFATYDAKGVTHDVTYAGKPVRMLTDAETPMDEDGEIISPTQPVTASAGTVSTE